MFLQHQNVLKQHQLDLISYKIIVNYMYSNVCVASWTFSASKMWSLLCQIILSMPKALVLTC